MKGVIEMLNYPQRKSIEITHHAMQRLEERVKNYDGFKKLATYGQNGAV